MKIISYSLNFMLGAALFTLFWIVGRSYSEHTNDWFMYIAFGLGIICIIGAIQGDGAVADGRYRTGYKGNITPDIGYTGSMFYIGANFLILGWGYLFLDQFRTADEIITYLKNTPWKEISFFIYATLLIFSLNGFMMPFAGLVMPSDDY